MTCNKSLLASAVFLACAGSAMAAGDSVQLFGTIDVGVTHLTGVRPAESYGPGTVSVTSLSSGVQTPSHFGMRGSEELGGGLRLLFDLETGFCATGINQNASTLGASGSGSPPNSNGYCRGVGFMQYRSVVGLRGDFGTVLGGRMTTPQYDNEAYYIDPFGWGTTGTAGNLSLIPLMSDLRMSQTVLYRTPDLAGFTGKAAYSFAPATILGTLPTTSGPGSAVPRGWALDGRYETGGFRAGLSYLKLTNVASDQATSPTTGANTLAQVYGGYDFGVAKVTAEYARLAMDFNPGSAHFALLGLKVPLGAGAVLASYSQNVSTMDTTAIGRQVARQYALGYTYSLSRRTNLYTSYARITNTRDSWFGVGTATDYGGENDASPGATAGGFALGIRHRF